MLAAAMVTCALPVAGAAGSKLTVPSNSANCPFTVVIIRWRAENSTAEWNGGYLQVRTGVAVAAVVAGIGYLQKAWCR